MEITDEFNTDKNKDKNKNKLSKERLNEFKNELKIAKEKEQEIKNNINISTQNEQIYIMAIQDLCARYELTISSMLNIITEMSNTKNHYLKMLGQLRQEKESVVK
jgi:hypothetical protein